MNKINLKLLNEFIQNGFITKRKHPNYDIWIHNYTVKTMYDSVWNELTLQCRGLVLDSDNNIIARPFKKFFNLEENRHISTKSFDIYEKMDGSLGIVFNYDNEWVVATRGSFASDQAIKGRELLELYNYEKLDPKFTYLFEIIYDENRIVLDYDYEGLVLLGCIESETGIEKDINEYESLGFNVCRKYNIKKDLSELKSLIRDDKEGFVIRFSNGERVKIKGDEYLRLHSILTNTSNVSIWEILSSNISLKSVINDIPDEFYEYIKKVEKELLNEFSKIEKECLSVFKVLDTRKETALYFLSQKYPPVLFNMLDNKPYEQIIWKIIKPKWEKPFLNTVKTYDNRRTN